MPETLQPPVKLNKKTSYKVSKSAVSNKSALTIPLSTSVKLKQRLQNALSRLMAESALNTVDSQNGQLIMHYQKHVNDKATEPDRLSFSSLESNPSKILLSSKYLNNYKYPQQKSGVHLNSKNHKNSNADVYCHRRSSNLEEILSSSPSSADIFDMSPCKHPFNSHLTDTDLSDLDIVVSASKNTTSSGHNIDISNRKE